MNKPRDWQSLERHPLSAEYPNLTNGRMQAMRESVRKGVLNERKVTLHEGKILDGFQFYTACLVEQVEPEFQPLPDGWTPEEYVAAMNDVRRHESADMLEARANRRRQRVAERREGGESIRSIAAAENVSQATVRRDLEAVTAPGGAVNPPSGKITGKDGRQQPATRPSIFCSRCARVGPVKGCEACKAERAGARKGRDAGSHEPKAPKKTAGRIIFDQKAFDRSFGDVVRTLDRVEKGYGHKQTDEGEALRKLLNEFLTRFNTWRKGLAKK
jgi:hypothetical protein